jgi:hypothetical protein
MRLRLDPCVVSPATVLASKPGDDKLTTHRPRPSDAWSSKTIQKIPLNNAHSDPALRAPRSEQTNERTIGQCGLQKKRRCTAVRKTLRPRTRKHSSSWVDSEEANAKRKVRPLLYEADLREEQVRRYRTSEETAEHGSDVSAAVNRESRSKNSGIACKNVTA